MIVRSWAAVVAMTAVAACADSASSGDAAEASSSTSSGSADTSQDAGDSGSGAPTTGGSVGSDGSTGGMAYPEPADWPPNAGPGGPAVAFDAGQLLMGCAFLDGGEADFDHHNLAVMFDGYLVLPWALGAGQGGISFFDVSDPCSPQLAGQGESLLMRETHAIGFAHLDDRRYAVVAHKVPGLLAGEGGVQFWDVTDPTAPVAIHEMSLPGHNYPDDYERVVLSTFWQVPYVFAGGADNGIYIIDASDPTNPELIHQEAFDPVFRVGQVQVIGNTLISTAAEGPRTVLLDVSVPDFPQPIAGGDFEIVDGDGELREAYFSNVSGGYAYYAIKNLDGGLVVYDIHDQSNPTYAGNLGTTGNGGYVFVKDDLAFMGESNFAAIYDVADKANITQMHMLTMEGDLDTMTPIGNIVVMSADDEAPDGQASVVAPWREAVDAEPPSVNWSVPADGAEGLPVSSRVGVTFSEMVDVKSAWEGSVRVYESGTEPASTRVEGHISVQENIVNFVPKEPLQPGTTYTFEIPAGGIVDYNGNAVVEAFSIEFTTAGG